MNTTGTETDATTGPAALELRAHWLTPDRGRPLLVLGPSLGTGVVSLWRECAQELAGALDIIGWDLPGHGDGAPVEEAFTLEDLAAAVVDVVDRTRPGADFVHAGVSVAGAVGLALTVERVLRGRGLDPARVRGSAVICSGARIGTAQGWTERADLVRREGTVAMVEGSKQRWFAPGFLERQPDTAAALLTSLERADKESYAKVCEALAQADARADLPGITVPVMVMGGRHDVVVGPEPQQEMAEAIPGSRLVIVDDAAHLAPAECPAEVAAELTDWIDGIIG